MFLFLLQFGSCVPKKQTSDDFGATDKDTDSSSLRMPIVIRDPSERGSGRSLEPQNASLVETHIVGKVPQGWLHI